MSGNIAAVSTSIGPGATNTLTGVTTAFADSIPFLLLTGAVHTYVEVYGVLQEIDRDRIWYSRGHRRAPEKPSRAEPLGGRQRAAMRGAYS